MKKFILSCLVLSPLFIGFTSANFSNEQKLSYTWAYNNWITTMPTIDKANMNWDITRIALAKMISNYAINILNKTPDALFGCHFTDIANNLDKQYDYWVDNACKLWLMWQWITEFRPYDKVTIAEFWTILSRLIYWGKNNWWHPYYQKHLYDLNRAWIMVNIKDPDYRNAIRWNVMTMLRRSVEWGDAKTSLDFYKSEGFTILNWWTTKVAQNFEWNKVLYYNDKYWFSIRLWDDFHNWWYLDYLSSNGWDGVSFYYIDSDGDYRWSFTIHPIEKGKDPSVYDKNNKYDFVISCEKNFDWGRIIGDFNTYYVW